MDLIGPYTIQRDNGKQLTLKAVTMIDPATGWFEIVQYLDKKAITIANLVEQTWLARYPRPTVITYDQGTEFVGHEFQHTMAKEYGIKTRAATTKNPQTNSILEQIHQVLGNLI